MNAGIWTSDAIRRRRYRCCIGGVPSTASHAKPSAWTGIRSTVTQARTNRLKHALHWDFLPRLEHDLVEDYLKRGFRRAFTAGLRLGNVADDLGSARDEQATTRAQGGGRLTYDGVAFLKLLGVETFYQCRGKCAADLRPLRSTGILYSDSGGR